MFHEYIASLYGETTYEVLAVIFDLYPIWLPLILGILFWEVWVRYIRYAFFLSTPTVLLEVKLPKEITQSPVNMELALNGFHNTGGEGNFIDRYWMGKTRPWFSLELVSIGGEIHFFIWTRVSMKDTIESQLYSQFPGLEISEVPDYAKYYAFDPEKNNVWLTDYKLSKPDPLPLRTYLEYGLEKNPDPENAVDPLTTLLEYMNTIKPHETLAIQFVIRAHKKEKRGNFFSKETAWDSDVIKLRSQFIAHAKAEQRTTFSDEEKKIIDSMNRSLVKYSFDVGMRCLYYADSNEAYNGGVTGYLRGNLWKPFGANFSTDVTKEAKPDEGGLHFAAWNSIGLSGGTNTDFDYPWQNPLGIPVNAKKRKQLSAFKSRMFFYAPYKAPTSVMTTESIATLFHFPGSYAATPGLVRIPSKRSQAPANLPI